MSATIENNWLKPQWYQVCYNLVAQRGHLALSLLIEVKAGAAERADLQPDDPARGPISDLINIAIQDGNNLLIAAAKTVDAGPKNQEPLLVFLRTTVEPTTAVLLAGLLTRPELRGETQLTVPDVDAPPPTDSIERSQLVTALENDSPGVHQLLIDFATSQQERVFRVDYNLACLLAGRMAKAHEEGARALGYLDRALERAPTRDRLGLASWANKDPSLDPVRVGRETEFKKLLNRYKLPELETNAAKLGGGK